ncbi:MAG TPA: hypothetical protein VIS48_01975 [Candidatus Kryptonia bacterium]
MAKKKSPKPYQANAGIEYRLLVEHFSNPIAKRSGVAFHFRTSEEFRNFVYDLVVESRREADKIYFKIVGLRTPLTDFPRPGPAVCRCDMEDLEPGEYTLFIDRRGKQVNQFKLSIKKNIKVLRGTRQGKFIEILTNPIEWAAVAEN